MKLENLNLVELNAQEVKEVEGGWIIPVIKVIKYIAACLVADATVNPSAHANAFANGFKDGSK
jgi:hypothetical protein